MNLLILGRGKTGALVAEIARERKHEVRVLGASDNPDGAGLKPETLRGINAVIDFTRPDAVLKNIRACILAKTNIVVGTTGWYEHIPDIRREVEAGGIGLLFGANFSVGVNLFFDIARAGASALQHQYLGHIFERHHSPQEGRSLRHRRHAATGRERVVWRYDLEITSFREGDVVGMHEVILDSPNDTIYLCHDAKSRRGFADGAVKGAQWIAGKQGFFDFRDIWRQL